MHYKYKLSTAQLKVCSKCSMQQCSWETNGVFCSLKNFSQLLEKEVSLPWLRQTTTALSWAIRIESDPNFLMYFLILSSHLRLIFRVASYFQGFLPKCSTFLISRCLVHVPLMSFSLIWSLKLCGSSLYTFYSFQSLHPSPQHPVPKHRQNCLQVWM
jgi:hypothetical protein